MFLYFQLPSMASLRSKRTWRASRGAATRDWIAPAMVPAVKVDTGDGGGNTRRVELEEGS